MLAHAFATVLLVQGAAPPPPPALTAAHLSGVWKMCYLPGLPDVLEMSTGYLVFTVPGEYHELRHDCCSEEPSATSGTYTLRDGQVVLRSLNNRGEPYERAFRFIAAAEVVLFDEPEGPARRAEVLAIGENENYGYARVYGPAASSRDERR